MKSVLSSLGLQHLLPVFVENQVGPKEVEMLVPEEFTALGVTTIGDKARLKQRCKDYLKGKSLDSPVMSKFRELNSKSKSNRNSRKMKLTKRLYIGWKHGHQDLYRLVHPAKGGGQFVQDVNKGCTLSELKSLLIDLYFPRGHCKAGNLHVNEVDATVVNYSGHTLPETIGDDPFTVGLYCDSRKSNPVRIYLQTEKVHFVNLGTPTVSLNRRGQNRLSLSKRSSEVRNQSATVTRSEQSPAKTSSQARALGQSTFQNNLPVTMPDQISTEHGTLVMRQDHSPTHQSTPLSRPDKSPSKKCAPVLVPGLNQIEQSIPETSSDLIPHQGSSRQRTLDLPDIPEPQGILITGTAYESQCNLYDTNMSSGISSNDIDVADSDNDPDLIAAVKASIEPKPTFEEAIRKWKSCKIDSADPVVILINRNNILDSVERAVKKHSFSWLKQVKVSFSGEEADDLGGPKREFFNLLMKEVKNLVGENGSLQHNLSKLEANVYYSAGRYIVWSILHGGGACKFLSTKVLDMLLGYNTELSIDDIADVDSKAFIIQLSEAETDNQMPVDWMLDIGLSPPFKVEKKEHLIKLALKQLQYYRIHAELQQFRKGLECFGFLDSIREYTDGIKSLLCASTERLSFAMFTENIQYNFSPVGSNYRREEENSVYALEAFIQDCCDDECEVVESEVLAFWTGTPEVPLHGFDKKLEVNFVNGIDLLPVAHTCDMSLEIPRGLTPDIFRNKMVTAVQWGGQFHLV